MRNDLLLKIFSGRIDVLLNASQKLGGKAVDLSSSYRFINGIHCITEG